MHSIAASRGDRHGESHIPSTIKTPAQIGDRQAALARPVGQRLCPAVEGDIAIPAMIPVLLTDQRPYHVAGRVTPVVVQPLDAVLIGRSSTYVRNERRETSTPLTTDCDAAPPVVVEPQVSRILAARDDRFPNVILGRVVHAVAANRFSPKASAGSRVAVTKLVPDRELFCAAVAPASDQHDPMFVLGPQVDNGQPTESLTWGNAVSEHEIVYHDGGWA